MTATGGNVLVAYDASEDAQAALEWSAEEAVLRDKGVTLLTAVRVPASSWGYEAVPHAQQLVDYEQLAREAQQVASLRLRELAPGVPVRTCVALDSAAHAVLQAAPDACEVVLGARGHRLASRMFLGSVSMHVALHDCRPTVVVRPSQPDGPVVVGVDGSQASTAALAYAVDAAARRGAALQVVHAWDVPDLRGYGSPGLSDEEAVDLEAGHHAMVEAELAAHLEQHPDLDAVAVAPRGHPYDVLLGLAKEARLLVVGSHGHGAVGRLFVGSVAATALARAHCTVAVVRPGTYPC